MNKLNICALFFLVTFLFGCVPPKESINIEATQLVNDMIKKRASLESIAARGEMDIKDRGSDFSLSIKIEMFAQHPQNLRIKASKLADAVIAFDMLMMGKDVAFYVPTQNSLYTGNISNLKSGGVNFSPEKIVARILRADRGLLDRRWKIIGQEKAGLFSKNLVLEQMHKPGESFVRIEVDGSKSHLKKVTHYTPKGKAFFVERYGYYKEFMTEQKTLSGKKIGSGVYFPTRFSLNWPAKGRSVKITLRDFEHNKSPEELEEIWVIDDLDMDTVKKKSIGKIKVDSDPK